MNQHGKTSQGDWHGNNLGNFTMHTFIFENIIFKDRHLAQQLGHSLACPHATAISGSESCLSSCFLVMQILGNGRWPLS